MTINMRKQLHLEGVYELIARGIYGTILYLYNNNLYTSYVTATAEILSERTIADF